VPPSHPITNPQIYLDRIQDLLVNYTGDGSGGRPSSDAWRSVDLRVREAPTGVYVEGLTTHAAGAAVHARWMPAVRSCVLGARGPACFRSGLLSLAAGTLCVR
jgi:hypothetical protein